MTEPRRRLPPWLIGMIAAAILTLIGVFAFDLLGFGDEPAMETGQAVGSVAAGQTVDVT